MCLPLGCEGPSARIKNRRITCTLFGTTLAGGCARASGNRHSHTYEHHLLQSTPIKRHLSKRITATRLMLQTRDIYAVNILHRMAGSYQPYYTPSRSIWEVKLA